MCTMGDPLKPSDFERLLAVFADAVDTNTDEVGAKTNPLLPPRVCLGT